MLLAPSLIEHKYNAAPLLTRQQHTYDLYKIDHNQTYVSQSHVKQLSTCSKPLRTAKLDSHPLRHQARLCRIYNFPLARSQVLVFRDVRFPHRPDTTAMLSRWVKPHAGRGADMSDLPFDVLRNLRSVYRTCKSRMLCFRSNDCPRPYISSTTSETFKIVSYRQVNER